MERKIVRKDASLPERVETLPNAFEAANARISETYSDDSNVYSPSVSDVVRTIEILKARGVKVQKTPIPMQKINEAELSNAVRDFCRDAGLEVSDTDINAAVKTYSDELSDELIQPSTPRVLGYVGRRIANASYKTFEFFCMPWTYHRKKREEVENANADSSLFVTVGGCAFGLIALVASDTTKPIQVTGAVYLACLLGSTAYELFRYARTSLAEELKEKEKTPS